MYCGTSKAVSLPSRSSAPALAASSLRSLGPVSACSSALALASASLDVCWSAASAAPSLWSSLGCSSSASLSSGSGSSGWSPRSSARPRWASISRTRTANVSWSARWARRSLQSSPVRLSSQPRQPSSWDRCSWGSVNPSRLSWAYSSSATARSASLRSGPWVMRRLRAACAQARLAATPIIRRAPRASTRTCSRAPNTASATSPLGRKRWWTLASWWRRRSEAPSASPRRRARSRAVMARRGGGECARGGPLAGRPGAGFPEPAAGAGLAGPRLSPVRKLTFRAGSRAIARQVAAIARWKPSRRSLPSGLIDGASALRHGGADRALDQLGAEATLVVLGDDRALGLVALVEEGEPEGEADVAEDDRVLGPRQNRARRHHGRDVAGHEAGPRQVGQAHHLRDDLAPLLVLVVGTAGDHDVDLGVVLEVVQLRNDVPAVHLALVDLLGAVVQAAGIAQADRVGGGEHPKRRVRPHHPVLVQQRQLALDLEDPLDHEHHVRPAGVVLVEHEGHRVLQRPGQHALAILGHLFAVAQDDGVLADQVDARNVAVQVDPHARPVEVGRDLLDVGRLAGPVVALDHHPSVVGKAREDRERGPAIEPVRLVDLRHVLGGLGERRHLQVGIDPETLPDRDGDVRRVRQILQADQPRRLGDGGVALQRSSTPEKAPIAQAK